MVERDVEIPLEIPLSRSISIMGPRRAGKTYEMFLTVRKLLERVEKKQVLYINLERADVGPVSMEDLVSMLETFYELYPENKGRKIWMFLDEVQNVGGWERFVRTAIDRDIKVYLSGSSSKLLSREIATSMRGRNISYTILPFSFREYLKAKNFNYGKYSSSSEKARMANHFMDYLEYGGYPEAVVFPEAREKILKEVLETTIYRDVIERARIRNVKVMKMLITALINSKEFSVNKFYNFLKSQGIKVGKNILYNYLEYLNDAFFVFLLRKFSHSYKKAEQSIPKVYLIDNGLLKISGVHDKGRLMENLVFIELLRRNLEISYYQETNKEEVDFVVKQGRKVKRLIQVCYDVQDFNTKDRETRALVDGSRKLKCDNLLVITLDYEADEKTKGKKIRFIPLQKWLMQD